MPERDSSKVGAVESHPDSTLSLKSFSEVASEKVECDSVSEDPQTVQHGLRLSQPHTAKLRKCEARTVQTGEQYSARNQDAVDLIESLGNIHVG